MPLTTVLLTTPTGVFAPWTCPPRVFSVYAEVGGPGANGGTATATGATGGGGGGEYAAEPALAVTPGHTYQFYIGRQGGLDASSTFQGDSVTVTAHSGSAVGANSPTGSNGGNTSTNTIHAPGGKGGNGVGTTAGGGGAGAPVPPGGAGNGGTPAGGTFSGLMGGNGGTGPTGTGPGTNGLMFGGGGSGAVSAGTTENGGLGAQGYVRLTYQLPPGPTIPFFPAGYQPQQSDFTGWWYDNAWCFQSRVVFRGRQTLATTSLPSSGAVTVIPLDTIDEDPGGGWGLVTANAWTPRVSGWYQITGTVQSAALATAGSELHTAIAGTYSFLMTQLQGSIIHPTGAEGTIAVYLNAGADTVQLAAQLLDSASNVNTSIAAGSQSSMEVIWLAS